jgi:hypothetical protein
VLVAGEVLKLLAHLCGVECILAVR